MEIHSRRPAVSVRTPHGPQPRVPASPAGGSGGSPGRSPPRKRARPGDEEVDDAAEFGTPTSARFQETAGAAAMAGGGASPPLAEDAGLPALKTRLRARSRPTRSRRRSSSRCPRCAPSSTRQPARQHPRRRSSSGSSPRCSCSSMATRCHTRRCGYGRAPRAATRASTRTSRRRSRRAARSTCTSGGCCAARSPLTSSSPTMRCAKERRTSSK